MKPALHYWLREGLSDNAEVDFVISAGTRVVPVEVKAGASGSLRSLLQFNHLRGTSLALRFDLNPPSRLQGTHQVRVKDGLVPASLDLVSLPLYLAEKAESVLGSIRRNEG